MGHNESAYVPEYPPEPPEQKKIPELGDKHHKNGKDSETNGSVMIKGSDPRKDDRFVTNIENKIKDDEDM